MAVSIRELLQSKENKKANSELVLKDINRELIVALLAIPVYGKHARDEEILSIIINAGAPASDVRDKYLDAFRERYNQLLKDKKIKKTKNGVRDTDGFIVLVPKS